MIISDLSYLEVASEASGVIGGGPKQKNKAKDSYRVNQANVAVKAKDSEVYVTVIQSNDDIDY